MFSNIQAMWDLAAQIRGLEARHVYLSRQIIALTREKDTFRDFAIARSGIILDLENQKRELAARNQELEARNQELEACKEEPKLLLDVNAERVSALEEQVKVLNEKNWQLERITESAKKRAADLRRENKELVAKIEQQKNDYRILERVASDTEDENESLKIGVEHLQQKVDSVQDCIRVLMNKNKNLDQLVSEFEDERRARVKHDSEREEQLSRLADFMIESAKTITLLTTRASSLEQQNKLLKTHLIAQQMGPLFCAFETDCEQLVKECVSVVEDVAVDILAEMDSLVVLIQGQKEAEEKEKALQLELMAQAAKDAEKQALEDKEAAAAQAKKSRAAVMTYFSPIRAADAEETSEFVSLMKAKADAFIEKKLAKEREAAETEKALKESAQLLLEIEKKAVQDAIRKIEKNQEKKRGSELASAEFRKTMKEAVFRHKQESRVPSDRLHPDWVLMWIQLSVGTVCSLKHSKNSSDSETLYRLVFRMDGDVTIKSPAVPLYQIAHWVLMNEFSEICNACPFLIKQEYVVGEDQRILKNFWNVEGNLMFVVCENEDLFTTLDYHCDEGRDNLGVQRCGIWRVENGKLVRVVLSQLHLILMFFAGRLTKLAAEVRAFAAENK